MSYADDANIGMAMGLSPMAGLGNSLSSNPHRRSLHHHHQRYYIVITIIINHL